MQKKRVCESQSNCSELKSCQNVMPSSQITSLINVEHKGPVNRHNRPNENINPHQKNVNAQQEEHSKHAMLFSLFKCNKETQEYLITAGIQNGEEMAS